MAQTRKSKIETKEPQNQVQIDAYRRKGGVRIGPWSSYAWRKDPRHLGFSLARYKFCAKMLAGKSRVLEIGCGDGIGVPVLLQTVKSVHAVDFEPLVVDDAKSRFREEGIKNGRFSVLDITKRHPAGPKYDGACSLDTIEHIPSALETRFMHNACRSLTPSGVFIVGTPNVEAHKHASPDSKMGHVNMKSADDLRALFKRYFQNVFIFSMNDEIVHTGFYPMAHYLLAVGVGVEKRR